MFGFAHVARPPRESQRPHLVAIARRVGYLGTRLTPSKKKNIKFVLLIILLLRNTHTKRPFSLSSELGNRRDRRLISVLANGAA